ncbi:hypothetical protein ACFV1N_37425 [Streptosporangium canum]
MLRDGVPATAILPVGCLLPDLSAALPAARSDKIDQRLAAVVERHTRI